MPPSSPSAEPSGLVAVWQGRGPLACLLYPVSLVFLLLTAVRRFWLRPERLPVPVVVVGNITVGGAGKTPLVVHLVEALRARGRRPGVVSRGYRSAGGAGGADGKGEGVSEVCADADPAQVGDEPLLLARRCRCPVFVGRDRVAAARALLAAHPECDLILSDDGLQHYRLGRDVEIAVFDARGAMNGWALPAGPLREPLRRLAGVDAIVFNVGDGDAAVPPAPTFGRPLFRMGLHGETFRRLDAPETTCTAADLAGLRLHAVAGIGAPQRFFAQLRALGLAVTPHAFPDHHAYRAEDLDFGGDAILATEKDAVKLAGVYAALPASVARPPVWVLPVSARLSPDLAAFVLEKLDGPPPA